MTYSSATINPDINQAEIQVIGIGSHGGAMLARLRTSLLSDVSFSMFAENESTEFIRQKIAGTELLIIVSDASDAAAVQCAALIGDIARQLGITSIATLTYSEPDLSPTDAYERLMSGIGQHVDSILRPCIPTSSADVTTPNAVMLAINELACEAIRAIASSVTVPGLINIGVCDLDEIIFSGGCAVRLAVATATGEQRVRQATMSALAAVLLPKEDATTFRSVFIHLASSTRMKVKEVATLLDYFDHANQIPVVIMAATIDETLGSQLRLTMLAAKQQTGDLTMVNAECASSNSLIDCDIAWRN